MLVRPDLKRVCRKCGTTENVRPMTTRGFFGRAVSIWVCDEHRPSYIVYSDAKKEAQPCPR